ncbi:hypothetical protein B484DRAFT_443090 [Ochromonadaceae sp. CCMP2298]|nr:hypothetical protein B484DRAFT_443090 [Ochromonadaceae sp. CCMP2298]
MAGSTKSKRFISAGRMARVEVKRKAVEAEEVGESEEEGEEEEEGVVSLLTLAAAKWEKGLQVKAARQTRREEWNETRGVGMEGGMGMGVEGVGVQGVGAVPVSRNAGPPPTAVPENYRLVGQERGAALVDPAVLVYKRVLYLWEGGREQGWFLGTIVATSEAEGCNFRIKYDREETGSLFVDGVHAVLLSLSGQQAYGRRWVALEKIDPKLKFQKWTRKGVLSTGGPGCAGSVAPTPSATPSPSRAHTPVA